MSEKEECRELRSSRQVMTLSSIIVDVVLYSPQLPPGVWLFLPPLLLTRLLRLRSSGDQVPGVEDDPSCDEDYEAFSMWSTTTAHRIYDILSSVQCVEFFYQVDNST